MAFTRGMTVSHYSPRVRYFRLRGIGGANYHDTADNLERLAGLVGNGPAYVFFNNLNMLHGARQFRDLAAWQPGT